MSVAEDFLTRPARIEREIRRQRTIENKMRESLLSTSQPTDKIAVQTSPDDVMARVVAEIDEIQRKIADLYIEKADAIHEIDGVLEKIPIEEREVLTYWYIMGWRDVKIGIKIGKTERTVFRIKAQGLESVEEILSHVSKCQ